MLLAILYRGVTRPTLARIEEVRRAASAIGHGALDTRLSVATRDELGLLMTNVNRMAARLARRESRVAADRAALEDTVAARTADLRAANARLEAVDQSRRRFFADVSHELRTPLTVILGECDLALRGASRSADPGPVFATIKKRAQRLKLRVEDLLRVARSESGQIEFDKRRLGLAQVLAEAVDNMGSEATRRRVGLNLDPGTVDVESLADREWLRQTVESLVDNALRHAAGLTRVEVALAAGPGPVGRITVTDDGPGFGASEDDLFERFKRGSGRRDRTRPGSASGSPWRGGSWSSTAARSGSGPGRTGAGPGSPWTSRRCDPAWETGPVDGAAVGARVGAQVKESAA
ncbi:sensor histidine kinase [Methylobacterium oryzae CBMB20]